MHKFIACALQSGILGVAFAAAPVFAQEDIKSQLKPAQSPIDDSQVELRNDSRWSLQELYFAPVGSDRWGPNQLSRKAVHPEDSFTLTGIRCDKYDVKLVDEDDNECVVRDVALCATDKIWHINDRDLVRCQTRTQR
jgi:hypothetical protein